MKMQSLKRASHMVLVAMAIKGHLCRSSSDMRITQLSSMPRQKCCDTKNLLHVRRWMDQIPTCKKDPHCLPFVERDHTRDGKPRERIAPCMGGA